MNFLVTIIAHRDGQAAFERHMELWLKHEAPILVCCPEDAPVPTKLPLLLHGKAQRAGLESKARLIALFTHVLKQEFSHYVIFEYDSFCLSPKIHLGRGLFGNVFANAESPKFMAPRYVNPPWVMDRDSLQAMLGKALEYPDILEEGEADRLLSAWAMLAGVPILQHVPKGFSRGLIGDANLMELQHAIYGGVTMIHGVKQNRIFRAALDFYDEKDVVNRV